MATDCGFLLKKQVSISFMLKYYNTISLDDILRNGNYLKITK